MPKTKKSKKKKVNGKRWPSVRLEVLEGLADYLDEDIPKEIKDQLKPQSRAPIRKISKQSVLPQFDIGSSSSSKDISFDKSSDLSRSPDKYSPDHFRKSSDSSDEIVKK